MCQLTGPDNLCFYGSRPIFGHKAVDAEIFFSWWCVALFWNIVNFQFGKYMRNFFRTECTFAEATFVNVLVKNKKNRMVTTNRIVEISRQLTKKFIGEDEFTFFRLTVPVDTAPNGRRSIDVLCKRYTYSDAAGVFEPAEQKVPTAFSELRKMPGLSAAENTERISVLGVNAIPYKVSTWGELMRNELNSYLYLYQFTIYSLWLWFSALTWGSPQVVVVLSAAVVSVVLTRYNQERIQKITEYSTQCTVCRGGSWITVDSSALTPGDKIKLVANNWVLPCDLVMVKGSTVCDESGLTGESMPVRKVELPLTEGSYNAEADVKHTLFAGTTVLQAGTDGEEVHAIVTNTGIRTVKGELISHILFPADMVFQYDEELRVVFTMLMIYAFFLFGISVWLQIKIAPLTWVSIFAFALFTISQILPPLLPIALVVGHTMSAKRLEQKQVLCVNPKRIAIAGKIHVFMFDKTGTLTKQGLDFLGVRTLAGSSSSSSSSSSSGSSSSSSSSSGGGSSGSSSSGSSDSKAFVAGMQQAKATTETLMGQTLATCHAVTKMGAQLVGNQVEVKMLEASGFSLVESGNAAPKVQSPAGAEFTIERRFEFDHYTMTMSVLVRDAAGEVHAFTKGAPEKVKALCAAGSLPADFDAVSQGHGLEGCYVIGTSHRKMGKLTTDQCLKMTRAEVEVAGKLDLVGLLLFRNELKPDTAAAIDELHTGDVRSVMLTGDNAQCGLFVAKEARLLKPTSTVWLGDVNAGGDVGFSEMGKLGSPAISTADALAKAKAAGKANPVEFAITGKALAKLTASDDIDDLVLHTRIFARVKPDQKVQVVQLHIDKGLITGMCGDGGNDCGALRAAHAGIALSDAEASVVSPFTSATKSVQSVCDLLKEGRCALATSFAAYRFYITYGLNWSVVKTINFVYGVRMPITGYLTVDSISSWLVAWAITLALPLDKLTGYRPTTSLFAPQIMGSVLGPWAMWMLLMGGALIMQQNDVNHVDFPAHLTKGLGYWQLGDNWEATIFTTFMVFPLIWSGIQYSTGSKFRRSVFLNKFLWLVWGTIFLLYSSLLLKEPSDATAVFHVASNAFNGRKTSSPIWMRYQFPRGCYTDVTYATTALTNNEFATATNGAGKGAWSAAKPDSTTVRTWSEAYLRARRGTGTNALPANGWSPDNCADINSQAKKCGPACEKQNPPYGDPTPGMSSAMRGNLYIMIMVGMILMILWENFLEKRFIKPDPPVEEVAISTKGNKGSTTVVKSAELDAALA